MVEEYIISEESANKQFELFCDYYGLDIKETIDAHGEDGKRAVLNQINKFKNAIRRGRISVENDSNNELIVRQILSFPIGEGSIKELIYYPLTGRAAIEQEIGLNGSEIAKKTCQLLGYLSRIGKTPIESLKGKDWALAGVCYSVFTIAG